MNNGKKVDEFDKYFTANYNTIKASAVTLLKHRDDTEDVLHNVYLTIRDRIERKGYSGSTYGGYIFISLQNEFKLAKNREKKFQIFDIDEDVTKFLAGWCLHDKDEDHRTTLEYMQNNAFIVQILFEYIEKNFDEKHFYLFRVYYLSKEKMTYKKLAGQTNYEFSTIQQIIKQVKKQVRNEFRPYLEKRYREIYRAGK